MDPSLIKMILLATIVIVVTTAIAKVLRIGTDIYKEQSERGQQVGRHCCLSGLADFSADLRKGRDQA